MKSSNLLLTKPGRVVKVADFGTSKILNTLGFQPLGKAPVNEMEEVTLQTRFDGVMGTIPWTAPELLSGEPFGLPIDVYSFAVVMWEMLTRQVPYEEFKKTFTIISHVKAGGRPPVPKDAAEDFAHLMTACWSQEPKDRPTFSAIVDSLSSMLHGANPDSQHALHSHEPHADSRHSSNASDRRA